MPIFPPVPKENLIYIANPDVQELLKLLQTNLHNVFTYLNKLKQEERANRDTIFLRPKEVNFDKTDATLTNVPDFSTNLQQNTLYHFEIYLFLSASAAGGVKLAINTTATGWLGIRYHVLIFDNTTNAVSISDTHAAAGGTSAVAGPTDLYAILEGQIITSTPGDFLLQFAQNAASGTSSILTGSTLRMEKMD